MKVQNLLNAIEQIYAQAKILNNLPPYLRDQVGDILAELIQRLYQLGDVLRIEKNILNSKRIDKPRIFSAFKVNKVCKT